MLGGLFDGVRREAGAGRAEELGVLQRAQHLGVAVGEQAGVAGLLVQRVHPVDELVEAVPERVAARGIEERAKVVGACGR